MNIGQTELEEEIADNWFSSLCAQFVTHLKRLVKSGSNWHFGVDEIVILDFSGSLLNFEIELVKCTPNLVELVIC